MPFRAQLSAAPLKRVLGDWGVRRGDSLPRSIERGPVEAVVNSALSLAGSLLPRSIERGPVEAETRRWALR